MGDDGRVVGARLREARKAARLTQEDVASDFRNTRQAISSWENGRTLPSLLEFRELIALYGVSADEILFGDDGVREAGRRLLEKVRAAKKRASQEPDG